jgi:hypothetical protein
MMTQVSFKLKTMTIKLQNVFNLMFPKHYPNSNITILLPEKWPWYCLHNSQNIQPNSLNKRAEINPMLPNQAHVSQGLFTGISHGAGDMTWCQSTCLVFTRP